MKLERKYSLQEIAAIIDCKFIGDPNHVVEGLNEIHRVVEGDIVFVDHPKYYKKAVNSAATTILIDQEVDFPEGKALLISDAPFDDFNRLTKHFRPFQAQSGEISSGSDIHESVILYPNVFVGKNVQIGAGSIIYPGAVIMDNTRIDENVIVGPNSVVGHSAFYYKKKGEAYDRMHTCGGVWLQSNVELGAMCTIDAGVSSLTIIGEGSKLDNQVHIGHDTEIGKHCLFAANVGIAGCVNIEDKVTIWGQVGCASDVTIGEGAVIMAQSGISKSLEGGKSYFGSPCQELRVVYREMAAVRRLPEIIENL
ncbi:LpxD N-terminal domain-containing protein [Lishizhenia sp.]|uniref:LpxD N-terminal domain-containing protein n=1 Tax=Lishizhenia sp. TaxID=2497594 RepID=UPI00299EDEF5|nr:LpxD N-terminal domain-containing protein [Lishizhenia sp.]MDX1445891.1 LpxD N-terminal domain-containing protein [Lishizhenia sp.]